MSDPFETLRNAPRLLIEARLRPQQGHKIQVTNFPDLGPARFRAWREKDKGEEWTNAVIVDSPQSMANHLEMAVWDQASDDWIEPLRGLPFIRIDCGRFGKTNTIRESHRLNSAYIWTGEDTPDTEVFIKAFREAVGVGSHGKKPRKKKDDDASEGNAEAVGVLDLRRFYKAVFKWDPNSVLHGVFLEKLAGRLRMTRLLSGFLDAYDFTEEVPAHGSKHDHVSPSAKAVGLSAEEGAGNVPFHGTQFAPKSIIAYFKIDLDQLRGYGLPQEAQDLLIALGLLKVRRLLGRGFKPRSNCDLVMVSEDLCVTGPTGFVVPPESDLLSIVTRRKEACCEAGLFADPAVIELKWAKPQKSEVVKITLPTGITAPASLSQDPLASRVEVKETGRAKAKKLQLTIKDGLDADLVATLKAAFDNDAGVSALLDEQLAKAEEASADKAEDEEGEE